MNLFLIGNSFSQNATRYLPELAAEGGYTLHLGRAEVGGCSLQRHWEHFEYAERGREEGKFYNGRTLRELLSEDEWDLVTLQQASINSSDVSSYRLYARWLCDTVQSLCPGSEIALHQTWAYRCDAPFWGEIGNGQTARSHREMWEYSRAAYYTIAEELRIRLIPVGDAFWIAASDSHWGYRPDPNFDFDHPVFPRLPESTHSLHTGYFWNENRQFCIDPKHASEAGSYLGSLVWYGFLFDESPQDVTFTPPEVAPELAAFLRTVAAQVLRQSTPAAAASD